MNIPNFASCHHAILCARVAACLFEEEFGAATDVCWTVIAPAVRAAYAAAPDAPSCFRNSRLETLSIFMRCILLV
jgi:hypothetical protein